jgi:hypothetical protein
MNSNGSLYFLKKLRTRYLFSKITEVTLWAFSAATTAYLATNLLGFSAFSIVVAGATFTTTILVGIFSFKLYKVEILKIISYLDGKYPELQNSSDLLIDQNNSLSPLELLQREKVAAQLKEIYPAIKLPNRTSSAALAFVAMVCVTFLLTGFKSAVAPKINNDRHIHKHGAKVKVLPATTKNFVININPPSYTELKSVETQNPELTVPEASMVGWSVEFSGPVEKAYLIFPNADTLKLTALQGKYTGSRKLQTSGFYQIYWKQISGQHQTSDYYKIEVIKDQAPEVTIPDFPQFTEFTIDQNLTTTVAANIKDDYAIKSAWIIATVSKGSGESVKFREEKLLFTTPQKFGTKQSRAVRTLDLKRLGLEPGDELYFYAEAEDNRIPIPNRSRTETYFISLKDTSTQNLSVEAGLGVDLMPDYFRSQRQIIIDTEKLLKKKKSISVHEFKSTSNELGYDQKVLRLKYGEFLGEEFETQIGPGESGDQGHADENQNVTQQYGHVHDKENGHNLVQEKKPNESGHHDHGNSIDPKTGLEKTENPADEYKHSHDSEEEATFFNQSVRSKLKAALSIMWDAELYLRLYEPEKSLPYQYRALKLLKEVSNDSRIYVHKTGFDPPPLKEEKRLTADLKEIRSTSERLDEKEMENFPSIRQALTRTEILLHKTPEKLTADDKLVFRAAGNELAGLALQRPGKFLSSLTKIKELTDDEIPRSDMPETLEVIYKAFQQALPKQPHRPEQLQQTLHSLDEAFLKNLDESKR